MVNVENIYLCIVPPLLLTLMFLKGEARHFNIFFITGMTVCLVCGSVNTLMLGISGYTDSAATVYLTPIVEEIFKLLPLIFWVPVFLPEKKKILTASLAIGIGFAILENCAYMLKYGSENLTFVLTRGFATGIMHGICTLIVGYGLTYVYDKRKLAVTGTFGLLCASMTFHAIFNMMVGGSDVCRIIALALPITAAAVIFAAQLIRMRIVRR